ncbi:MAG TPA: hypothetical protein VKB57_25095 [Acidimicrobiales bacterium]|nr:hypothetical protein [Acidimicrobiales bacterium]
MPSPLSAVLDNLFDNEGLLSADRRPMADALAAHADVLAGPHAGWAGPFVCPVSRLGELDACVAAGVTRPPALAIVGSDGPAAWRRAFGARGLVQVEAPGTAAVPSPPGRVVRYVEITRRDPMEQALDAVAGVAARVKVRCEAASRDATPDHTWLARILVGCADRGLALKAAGGPAHAYGADDGGGAAQGIVNLLAAAGAARAGEEPPLVARILAAAEPDAEGLLARIGHARELLAAIGTPDVPSAAEALTSRNLA